MSRSRQLFRFLTESTIASKVAWIVVIVASATATTTTTMSTMAISAFVPPVPSWTAESCVRRTSSSSLVVVDYGNIGSGGVSHWGSRSRRRRRRIGKCIAKSWGRIRFGSALTVASASSSSETSSSSFPPSYSSQIVPEVDDHRNSPDHRSFVLDLDRYESAHDVNAELDVLARRCGDDIPGVMEDVIGCAALAEEVLRTWERRVTERKGKKEEEEERRTSGRSKSIEMKPDGMSYNKVVQAWSKACATLAEGRGRGTVRTAIGTDLTDVNVYSARDAAARAEQVLLDLERRYLEGSTDVAPITSTYNFVLDAWAKSRCSDASSRAEALLDRMVRLSSGAFEVKSGGVGSGGGEGREGEEELVVVNGAKEKWERVRPDVVSYNSVIEAWAHSPDPDALRKASETLEMLEREYGATGDPHLKPNIRTVNQVINAYAKRGREDRAGDGVGAGGSGGEHVWSAARKAERLLNTMTEKFAETGDPDFKPDTTTYTSVCDCYSRVGDVAASERAELLLNRIEKCYNETGDPDLKPNYKTYTAVISAWSKTPDADAPYRAERILRRMESLHAEAIARGESGSVGGGGAAAAAARRDSSVKPNARTYTAVINAWARSRDGSKAQRALRILKKMLDLYRAGDELAKPSLYAYNACIEACSRCRGSGGEEQVKALKIAFAVNKALSQAKGVEANHVTYSILMKCVNKLLPAGEERNKVAKALFEKCVKAGMVDSSVLRQLQMATDRDLYYELCKPLTDVRGFVNFSKVPQEWKKNVR